VVKNTIKQKLKTCY